MPQFIIIFVSYVDNKKCTLTLALCQKKKRGECTSLLVLGRVDIKPVIIYNILSYLLSAYTSSHTLTQSHRKKQILIDLPAPFPT